MRILVGISGGVDSALAAKRLMDQGHEVEGAILIMHEHTDVAAAEEVAESLGINLHKIYITSEFLAVMSNFVEEYTHGRTPNPCIICNERVKFSRLYNYADVMGYDAIATGHYARILQLENGRYTLKMSATAAKDQTYALCNLSQEQLAGTRMPLGDYTKDEIRAIASEIGLPVAEKAESMEICFIPDNNHGEFIKRAKPNQIRPGYFVDKDGNKLGKHKGIVFYTIGQRKGLGLSLGTPVYVTDIVPFNNTVVVGSEEDIFKTELLAKDINLISIDELTEPLEVEAKIRYSGKPTSAIIYPLEDNKVKVVFKEKVRAITKGQSVVFYKDDYVVGGGVIDKIL